MNFPMSANSTIESNLRLVSASLIPRIAPLRKRFSRPVGCGWNPAPVAIRPAMRPRVRMVPVSGRSTPLISFSSVLFPEPFRPIRPTDSPCSTVKDTSSTARNFSWSGRRRTEATAICFRVRWYCIVNCLETFSTLIETVMSEALRELALDAREEFLREPQEDQADSQGDQAALPQVRRELPGEPAGVLDEGIPEELLQEQHRLRDRVGQVDLVEPRMGVVRRPDPGERVHHRHQEVHELHDRLHDVLEVAVEHVDRREEQRQGQR